MGVSRRGWLRVLGVVSVLAVGGCLAPTLPVPPPAQPEIVGPDENGIVTLKGAAGSARPNAEITVWNPNLDEGRGEGRVTTVGGDGSWTESIPATSKTTLYVWQTIGFERSQHVEVLVP